MLPAASAGLEHRTLAENWWLSWEMVAKRRQIRYILIRNQELHD